MFIVGFEDGLFPGMRAIGDAEEMEEERRLCYVAITRAKERLTISYARQRMLYGRTNAAMQSRFLRELPENVIERKGNVNRFGYSGGGYGFAGGAQQVRQSNTSPYTYRSSVGSAPRNAAEIIDFKRGDMVKHTAFGRGMVLSVIPMGGDALLEIAFDQIGTRKLMAKTASAHMKKL